jgi:phage terminase large subunit-like protein
VLNDKIVAGEWVRKACQRHRDDRQHGKKRGIWFDENSAAKAIRFFALLRHSKGEWAGQVFVLEPWQQFIVWCLFGWKREGTDFRRFRTAYLEVARKNGKSTLMAGIGLYLFFADNEPGAEVYTAATKRDQAKIVWGEAKRMVQSSPGLRSQIGVYVSNMHIPESASKFEPLGADEDSLDGLNIHAAIVDELHAHKTRNVWDVLETATGSRRQPIQLAVTTAGHDRHTICWEQHEYVEKILDKVLEDDTYFGLIYTTDPKDDWQDQSLWIKSNPNIGVSVKEDDLIRKAERAREVPTALNAFLRLHMNQWTESETRWLSPESWNKCADAVNPDALRGRICYGGLDLSTTTDLSAFILVFPPLTEDDKYELLCRFFVPQDNIAARVKRDRVPYDVWIRQGLIKATPGNVIDYAFILNQIDEDSQNFDLREIAFDRWGAAKITQDLQDRGLEVVAFGQGFQSMSAPSKELEKLVLGQQLSHGGNAVLSWMMSNVVMRTDPAGNLKPDKEKSREKIDGVVAAIMALDRALRVGDGGKSVYETRGVLTFPT